jgi:hypothetical protein
LSKTEKMNFIEEKLRSSFLLITEEERGLEGKGKGLEGKGMDGFEFGPAIISAVAQIHREMNEEDTTGGGEFIGLMREVNDTAGDTTGGRGRERGRKTTISCSQEEEKGDSCYCSQENDNHMADDDPFSPVCRKHSSNRNKVSKFLLLHILLSIVVSYVLLDCCELFCYPTN